MNRLLVAIPLILSACASAPAAPSAPASAAVCSAASIADVQAALESVPGYSFTATGTALNPTFETAIGPGPYEYQSPKIALGGSYQAPDRSRLEVLAGRDAHPPLGYPHLFFLGADAMIVVGDRAWLVGKSGINDVSPSEPGTANLLLVLLRGAPEAGEVHWSSAGACGFRGEQRKDWTDVGSMTTSLQVEVGPGALPLSIVEEWRFEETGRPKKEYMLTYVPEFGRVPEIGAPGP